MAIPASEIKLSILILSIPSRLKSLEVLMNKLQEQIGDNKSVEILVLLDNKSKSISEKRNDLLASARGLYLCFLDDDDEITDEYISSILEAIQSNSDVDCITFNQWCSLDGEPMNVRFNLGNPHQGLWRTFDGKLGDILRPPYHMCPWKASIAKSEKFEPVYGANGQSIEDIHWLSRLYPKAKTEYHIDKILHHYIYNSKTTESLVPKDKQ